MLRRVLVALTMAALASTSAAPQTATADDGTGAVVEGKLVLVLDSSGSMSEPADGA